MNTVNVLLLEGIHQSAIKLFEQNGYAVISKSNAMAEEELISFLLENKIHILGIRSKTKITEKLFSSLCASTSCHLLCVGCFCIGTNQVDLKAANYFGIPVFNAPFANTRSVAELVIGEVIALSRKLCLRSSEMHQGDWQKSANNCFEIRGKTLGIIGYGHIGSQLGVLAESLGMNVMFYDVIPKLALGNNTPKKTMVELLSSADFVTCHVPELPSTQNMITAVELKHMKPGSYFLNLSRGTVVDVNALADALQSKHLAGAALDVYPEEPEGNGLGFKTPVQKLPNVILTPHIGGSTIEAQAAIGIEVATSMHKFIHQGATTGAVNVPHVEPQPGRNCERIINIHRNVPGVMRSINKIIGDHDVNIIGQVLSTDSTIGIVVLDIAENLSEDLFASIMKMDVCIKGRVCFPFSATPTVGGRSTPPFAM